MNSLPFASLLPYDNRVLLLDYEPLIPICYDALAEESQTSDSDTDTTTD